jgi:hypothetical protein
MPVLESIAVHRLIAGSPATAEYIGAAEPNALEPLAMGRVQSYVDGMAHREEGQGRSQAAWWVNACPVHIAELLTCDVKDFDTATRAALDVLVFAARGKQVQSGLILFVRSRDGKKRSLLCLKMQLEKEQLALFQEAETADRAIHVEDIANKIPVASDLKKGALIPHPRGGADLRVLDEQLEEPAEYWLEFLGARARRREPDTMKLTVVTTAAALREQGVTEPLAAKALGESLQATIDGGKLETPKAFVERVAERAGVPATPLWDLVSAQQSELTEPESAVGPDAAALQKTTIALGPNITVSGLSIYLDERYDWHPAPPGQEGWVLEVTSDVEPKVTRTKGRSRR